MDYAQPPPVNGGHTCALWVPDVDDGTTCCGKVRHGNVLSSRLCRETKNALKGTCF